MFMNFAFYFYIKREPYAETRDLDLKNVAFDSKLLGGF